MRSEAVECKCWSWGSAGAGVLCQGDDQDLHLPTLSTIHVDLPHALVCSGRHCLMTTAQHRDLVGWGASDRGQLGQEASIDGVWVPRRLGLRAVTSIACGWEHSLAVVEEQALYVWGSAKSGALGLGDQVGCSEPTLLALPGHIVEVDAGWRHSVARGSQGEIWTWGDNRKGQCAVRDRPILLEPVLVREHNVHSVRCGWKHTVCIEGAQRRVVAAGDNKHGQLGSTDEAYSPEFIAVQIEDVPLENVTDIACGWSHNIAVVDHKQVWSWGRRNFGQIGRSDQETFGIVPIDDVKDHQIVAVKCGSEHSCYMVTDMLTGESDLFMFGWNEHGNIGVGDTENRFVPIFVKRFENILVWATGGASTLVITK